ncbi:MAG: PLP-dependent aminotransferase family protein [Nitriliruptoraceae bacterium]|nr:PLP-dependent aminotransferase family protein [Nitriliruptoraceae bacterium]
MDHTTLSSVLAGWSARPGRPAQQLVRAVAGAIEAGTLPAGTHLPAERRLAEALGVSRGTIARAFAQLRDDGLVETRHGAGTVVRAAARDGARGATPIGTLSLDASVATLGADVGDRQDDGIDLRTAAWRGDANLLDGLRRWTPDALRSIGEGDNGYWPLGLPSLRTAIAERLTAGGLESTPDQIVVTGGAQQALDVVLTTLASPGDEVVVAEVTWPGIRELLAIRGMRPAAARLDPTGAVDQVELLRMLRTGRSPVGYLVPSFDNPTGVLMPAPVRRLVVEAALEAGTVLIDDVTMHELWIDEPPPLPLAAMLPDAGTRVVTVGSLSKISWAGLRLGWLRAEGPLLERLGRVKTALDFGTSVPGQLAGLAVMGELDELVLRYRRELGARRDAALEAIATHLPAWRVSRPAGGMAMWAHLGGVASDPFVEVAARHGVLLVPGRIYHALGHDTGHIRLTLAHDVDTTVEAVRRLAGAYDEYLAVDRGRRVALV